MLDLTSLVVLAGLFLSLVVGDAVLFSDPVSVQITVPQKVSDAGLTETAAEDVFSAQVAELSGPQSFVKTPSVQISTRPGILAALAKPLSLDKVVIAIQDQAGADVISVRGVIVEPPSSSGLDMTTVISRRGEAPQQIRLSQADGDATVLVQRSAEWVTMVVAPYRLALTKLASGVHGNPALLQRAKQVADDAIARETPRPPATEQIMLHNLLAILAMLNNDVAEAEAQFRLTDQIPGGQSDAYGLVALNRSFLDVAAKRPADAASHYRVGMALTADMKLHGWDGRMQVLGALVAWSGGDLVQAEWLLRQSIANLPGEEAPPVYLAQLLGAEGDAVGAAAERAAAASSYRSEVEFPSLPQALFWVDPVQGGMRRRI